MQVFKFGGASIQSAEAVKKAAHIIQAHEDTPLVVIISAMGKTTRNLEAILQKKIDNQPYQEEIQQSYFYHQHIARSLLVKLKQKIHQVLTQWQEQLIKMLSPALKPHLFDKLYDQFVAHGELIASKIIYYYLKEQGMLCKWVDARKYIRTNSKFRNAQVDWKTTHALVKNALLALLKPKQVVIIQGFIGSDEHRQTTTLGKEGSDFTGAIVASILEATSLTLWKDVPGIMNADPKEFDNTIKFDQVSYKEMAEMAFYGAKVVHPKTIQPLAFKDIPLYVKPLEDPHASGTKVYNGAPKVKQPIYVLRKEQCLVTFYLKDLSFFNEQQLSNIFHQLDQLTIKIAMMERAALSFSICFSDAPFKVKKLVNALNSQFKIRYNTNLSLLTIKQQGGSLPTNLLKESKILLAHKNREVYQVVFQNSTQTTRLP